MGNISHGREVTRESPRAAGELYYTENALAHRGVLRGGDLWFGWNYTNDLVKLWAQLDNYNFWLRKFTVGQGWGVPVNVSRIEDRNINVREPRILEQPNGLPHRRPGGPHDDRSDTLLESRRHHSRVGHAGECLTL